MVYGTYNELATGVNLNQLISWGPHIVENWGQLVLENKCPTLDSITNTSCSSTII